MRLETPLILPSAEKDAREPVMADLDPRISPTAFLMRQWEFLIQVINAVADPIFVKDEKHRFMILNESFCRFMGRTREELIGKDDYDFFPKEQADIFRKKDEEVFASGVENVNEEFLTNATGETRTISTKKCIFKDPHTGERVLVGVIRDITEIKRAEHKLHEALEQLRSLSNSDELTQLANRRHFLALAEHQVRIAHRSGQGVLLLFADMDNLKVINDQLGHPEGDAAIVEVSKILRHVFRDSDVIARVGGDEFVILMTSINQVNLEAVVERLNQTLEQRNRQNNTSYPLSLSIGAAFSDPASPVSISQLLEEADQAMYREKRQRRCR
jgi:diguanylate cyclase (GGDEF)-like protein/PAS domain S-box-containing protein